MSRAPWTPDHELDAAGARARIEEAFDLRPSDVRYFAEGYDFFMFAADEWLFRFPKREGEVLRLEREVALLDMIADQLPVEVPRYEFRAPGLAGYRRIEGLKMVGNHAQTAFAASLGAFASALQSIEVGDMALPGDGDIPGYAQHAIDVRKGLDAARLDAPLHARCAAILEDVPADGPDRRLVHNDIYPEHVLLAGDGSIHAIIDWGDAIKGDPAGEFAVAYFWGGEAMLQAALASYGDVDTGFADRARFGGACMAIGHTTYGARTDKQEYVRSGLEAFERF